MAIELGRMRVAPTARILVLLSTVLAVACAPSTGPASPTAAAPTAVPTAAPAPAATQAGAATHLSIAYSNLIIDNTSYWSAKEFGIYAQNGLDVDLQYIASSNAMAALLAGQVQLAVTGGSEAINANANGSEVVVVANTTPVYGTFLETRPEIKTAADLKGKTIAITNPGASFDITTRVLLQHEGLDPDKDVTLVKTGSVANVTAALLSGQVDAGLAGMPDNLKLEQAGLHPLFDMTKMGLPASGNVILTQRAYATTQRDTVQRVIDSIVEALGRARKDKPATVAILQNYMQTQDRQGMEAAYDFYLGSVLPGPPVLKPEQFVDAQRTTAAANPKASDVRLESIIDPSFVQSSIDRGVDKR
jgi:NitT/TauT family transport system substrate-binding protein